LIAFAAVAQYSAEDYYKKGKEAYDNDKYNDALFNFRSALQLSSQYSGQLIATIKLSSEKSKVGAQLSCNRWDYKRKNTGERVRIDGSCSSKR
jgi:site-specific recombinase XerD